MYGRLLNIVFTGSPALTDYGNSVICSVHVDYGDSNFKLLAESEVLMGEVIHIFDLDIEDAKKIKLTVDSNGSYICDSTTWAYSVIYIREE